MSKTYTKKEIQEAHEWINRPFVETADVTVFTQEIYDALNPPAILADRFEEEVRIYLVDLMVNDAISNAWACHELVQAITRGPQEIGQEQSYTCIGYEIFLLHDRIMHALSRELAIIERESVKEYTSEQLAEAIAWLSGAGCVRAHFDHIDEVPLAAKPYAIESLVSSADRIADSDPHSASQILEIADGARHQWDSIATDNAVRDAINILRTVALDGLRRNLSARLDQEASPIER